MANTQRKWINLHDENDVKLMVGSFRGRTVVVIRGVQPRSEQYYRVLSGGLKRAQDREGLSFKASPSGLHLVHTCSQGESVFLGQFKVLWPRAAYEMMDARECTLDFERLAKRQQPKEAPQESATGEGQESVADVLNESLYLGRNFAGDRVFENLSGRFFVTSDDRLVQEGDGHDRAPAFLRARNEEELRECATGLLRACDLGESQKLDDLLRFSRAVLSLEAKAQVTIEDRAKVSRAIDSAVLAELVTRESVHAASADAAYYQEMMPGRATLAADSASTPYVPVPVAVQVQRLLHQAKTLRLAGKIPPYGFGLLPDSMNVFVSGPDTAAWEAEENIRPVWTNVGNGTLPINDCDAGYLRLSRAMTPQALERFAQSVAPDGHCVVTAGSVADLSAASAYIDFGKIICVPPWLSQTELPLYVAFGARLQAASREALPAESFAPVSLTGWDDMKIVVDEMLRDAGRIEELRQSRKADTRPRGENKLQRPYLARSKVSPAFTMVPRNLQTPIAFALSRVEEAHGPVDQFFADEMGISVDALTERFASEQIDAAALAFHRIYSGKGFILGDETGVGKGRVLAAATVWAMRQGVPVVFITDKATLFSDLARDLIDIGEWDRVRPLITNSDGDILNIMGDGEVLVQATPAAQMKRHIDGERHGANVIFTTYSQINGEDSPKAKWLAEQARGALVIADESHIAAGSDSNIANNLSMMLAESWGTIYSSATWAKSSKNLHIYGPAFPDSVSIAQITEAMTENAASFGEVFSSMLALDGAFVRREHDLSKVDFVIEIDHKHLARNQRVQSQVSEILGMMSMISGDITHMLQRMNTQTREAITEAKAGLENINAAAQRVQAQEAMQALGTGEARVRRAKPRIFSSSFGTGGAIYSVMRRTLAALSVDHVVDLAMEDLQEGRRTAIVLDETGESFVQDQIADEMARIRSEIANLDSEASDAQGEDAQIERERIKEIAKLLDAGARATDVVKDIRVPTIKDMMRGLVRRLGGIQVSEERPDPQAGVTGKERLVAVAQINVEELPGARAEDVQKYQKGLDELNAKIDALPEISLSPMDEIRSRLEAAGLKVGEISGRTFELRPEHSATPGLARLTRRSRKKTDVTRLVRTFNSENDMALVFNRSAATGLSMQASERFKNRAQRHLIEAQADENPATRIQLYGRVNRAGQVVPPRISIASSGLSAELRSIMMQNKKLVDLSANIRSSRENAAVIEDVPDLLNAMGDRVCQEYLKENPAVSSRMDIPAARIEMAAGLANLLTQRLVLLSPENQDVVYRDLKIAYEDAKLESEFTHSSDSIVLHDWRAVTIAQTRAWGPPREIAGLSAFDGPVYSRVVSYEYDYQPLRWEAVLGRLRESTRRLLEDPRVTIAKAMPRVLHGGKPVFNIELEAENALSTEVSRNLFAGSLMEYLIDYLPEEDVVKGAVDVIDDQAQVIDENTEQPELELEPDAARPDAQTGRDVSLNRIMQGKALRSMSDLSKLPKADKLTAIAANWVGTKARRAGSLEDDRFMALISRSGESAKLWQADRDKGEARVWTLNLREALKARGRQIGRLLKEGKKLTGLPKDHWIFQRFSKVWGSYDAQAQVLDISTACQAGVAVLEAQKILSLPSTGFESVEKALEHPEGNAVKDMHQRALFLSGVVPRLVPGVVLACSAQKGRGMARLAEHFGGKFLRIVDVTVPTKGEESLLSHWKFAFAVPGEEKVFTLSGAMLLKLAGPAPLFSHLEVTRNCLLQPLSAEQRAFEVMFVPGAREVVRTLLVGNAFQANQWARESKLGTPILYTDEAGATHRAVHIRSAGAWQVNHEHRFPIRLSQEPCVLEFFKYMRNHQDNEPISNRAANLYTSIRGALAYSSFDERRRDMDALAFSPDGKSIIWKIPAHERDRIRRTLRAAVAVDRRRWQRENPDRDVNEYPCVFSTRSPKRTAKGEQAALTITLPETQDGLERFVRILVHSQGFQLVIPHHTKYSTVAGEIEEHFYDNLESELAETARQQQEQNERRKHRQELIGAPVVQAAQGRTLEGQEQEELSSEGAEAGVSPDADEAEVVPADDPDVVQPHGTEEQEPRTVAVQQAVG